MRWKEKTKVIDFKTFISEGYVDKPKLAAPIYGFMPSISASSFLHMSPEIGGLYALVIGVGSFAMLSHCLEVIATAHGYEEIASFIETTTRLLFPIAAFSFIGWFLFSL